MSTEQSAQAATPRTDTPRASAYRVALTGGVGSGKSTVGRLLRERGVTVVDADAIAREVVEPGTPGLDGIVARFGPGILQADGTLDRAGLAAIVFSDREALTALNAITHPLIRARSEQLLGEVDPAEVAVYEIPLLIDGSIYRVNDFDVVVVVESTMPVRLSRLAERGLPEEQAKARIAAQATDEERRAVAGHLIHNDGSVEDLAAQVDATLSLLVAESANRHRPGSA